jgi:hypothetical protein
MLTPAVRRSRGSWERVPKVLEKGVVVVAIVSSPKENLLSTAAIRQDLAQRAFDLCSAPSGPAMLGPNGTGEVKGASLVPGLPSLIGRESGCCLDFALIPSGFLLDRSFAALYHREERGDWHNLSENSQIGLSLRFYPEPARLTPLLPMPRDLPYAKRDSGSSVAQYTRALPE